MIICFQKLKKLRHKEWIHLLIVIVHTQHPSFGLQISSFLMAQNSGISERTTTQPPRHSLHLQLSEQERKERAREGEVGGEKSRSLAPIPLCPRP